MDDRIKENLKKAVEQAETGIAKSILRWKFKREGKPTPSDHDLDNASRQVASRAHEVLARRGRNAIRELKKAYLKSSAKKEDSSD